MLELFDHVGPFVLVLSRLSGVMILAPLLASASIPTQARALLAVMMTLAVYPVLPAQEQAASLPGDVLSLGVLVAGETLVGFSIGLVAMLPLAAAQLAGLVMGLQMGFGLAAIVNPALETESDLLGEALLYLALGAFLAMGGLEALFLAAASSFGHVPMGMASASMAPAQLVSGVISSGFEVAMRVSLPLMAIILAETIATGFLAKTIPQMNILSLGFAVKVIAGLAAIVAGLRAMDGALSEHVGETMRRLLLAAQGG